MSFDHMASGALSDPKKTKKKNDSVEKRRNKKSSSGNLKDMEQFHDSSGSVDSAVGLFSLTGGNSGSKVLLSSSSHSNRSSRSVNNRLDESFAEFSHSLLDTNDFNASLELSPSQSLLVLDTEEMTKKKKKVKSKQSSDNCRSRSPSGRTRSVTKSISQSKSPTGLNTSPTTKSRSRSKSPSEPNTSLSKNSSKSRAKRSKSSERSSSLGKSRNTAGSDPGARKTRSAVRPKREKSSGSAGSLGSALAKNGISSTHKRRDDENSNIAGSLGSTLAKNGKSSTHKRRDDENSQSTSGITLSNANKPLPKNGGNNQNTGESVLEQAARSVALARQNFYAHYTLKNQEKEKSIIRFQGDEIILGSIDPIRTLMNYSEYQLKAIHSILDRPGQFPAKMEATRKRIMDRSTDGSYSIKIVRRGLLEQPEVGPAAAADIALECCILKNLPGHPNIAPLYGINVRGLTALTENDGSLRGGFFMITDRIEELLPERLQAWRNKQGYDSDKNKFSQRLEVALDISSALQFLHDRQIVFHIRPSKVGFDAKHSCLKLFNFGEARQDGMKEQSRFLNQSADMNIFCYTAPEVLCNAPVTCSSDVFGFAILLWQILSLKQPFEGMSDRQQYFQEVVEKHVRPRISSKWPAEIGTLLQRCWDPHLRMSMTKVTEELENLLLF